MKVIEYLKSEKCPLVLAKLAAEIWPKNKSAKVYLDKKLRGERPWTKKDSEITLKILEQHIEEIKKLKP